MNPNNLIGSRPDINLPNDRRLLRAEFKAAVLAEACNWLAEEPPFNDADEAMLKFSAYLVMRMSELEREKQP